MATERNNRTLVALEEAFGSTSGVPTVPGPGGSTTATVTRTAVSTTNVTLKAANTARRALTIYNNSAVSNLFLKLGATAVITAGSESFTVRLVPGAYYEVPGGYTGIVDGIWDVADAVGEALVTEITA